MKLAILVSQRRLIEQDTRQIKRAEILDPSSKFGNIRAVLTASHRGLIESLFFFAIRDLDATDLGDKNNMFVEQVTEFGCEMLHVLGLAESDVSGYKPTRVLEELVFARYLEHAAKQLCIPRRMS